MQRTSFLQFTAAILILAAICVLVTSLSAGPGPRQPQVQVETEYNVGPAQTDAGRAIDMAERVAVQNQELSQAQLARIEKKLDGIMDKLNNLDQRLAGIEKHLGIAPPPQPTLLPAPGAAPKAVQPTK